MNFPELWLPNRKLEAPRDPLSRRPLDNRRYIQPRGTAPCCCGVEFGACCTGNLNAVVVSISGIGPSSGYACADCSDLDGDYVFSPNAGGTFDTIFFDSGSCAITSAALTINGIPGHPIACHVAFVLTGMLRPACYWQAHWLLGTIGGAVCVDGFNALHFPDYVTYDWDAWVPYFWAGSTGGCNPGDNIRCEYLYVFIPTSATVSVSAS